MRIAAALALAVTTLLLGVQVAAALQAFGVGTPAGAGRASATTSTAWCAAPGGSPIMLFPAGRAAAHQTRLVVVEPEGLVTCCAVGAASGIDLANGGIGTDAAGPNGTGSGSCATIGGSTLVPRWDLRPRHDVASLLPGGSVGLCTVAVTQGVDTLYAPCRVDGDCSSYGGGTCDTTPSLEQLQRAGTFIACEADSGTVRVHCRKESVDL